MKLLTVGNVWLQVAKAGKEGLQWGKATEEWLSSAVLSCALYLTYLSDRLENTVLGCLSISVTDVTHSLCRHGNWNLCRHWLHNGEGPRQA
jgi:hypothetical protein